MLYLQYANRDTARLRRRAIRSVSAISTLSLADPRSQESMRLDSASKDCGFCMLGSSGPAVKAVASRHAVHKAVARADIGDRYAPRAIPKSTPRAPVKGTGLLSYWDSRPLIRSPKTPI